jgi:hypothetical protein
LHDLAAVDFDCNLTDPKLVCDLLVDHASHDEIHHLALARSEFILAGAQGRNASLYRSLRAVLGQCLIDCG